MAWTDIAELEIQYFPDSGMFSGKIKSYVMRLRDGGQFNVPSADMLDMRGPFEHRMMELVTAAGVRTTQRVA